MRKSRKYIARFKLINSLIISSSIIFTHSITSFPQRVNEKKQYEVYDIKEIKFAEFCFNYNKHMRYLKEEQIQKEKIKNEINKAELTRIAYKKELKKIESQKKKEKYIKEYNNNLYLLSHLIMGEAGSDWCTNELQLAVGSVVLNRVNHKDFPNTIEEVIFQKNPLQYACTVDGNFYKTPNDRAIKNAKYLLDNGSQIPEYVIYQSQGRLGEHTWKLIGTEYFCY